MRILLLTRGQSAQICVTHNNLGGLILILITLKQSNHFFMVEKIYISKHYE